MNKPSSEAGTEVPAVRREAKRLEMRSKKERSIAGALLLRFYSVTLCSA
ncbi:hypothetical protein L3476_28160 [Paenibacillus thiaminolyticus]|nr:hypothetical protein [Paenibacillus thiaminolyticus]WCR30175.1 hypothetical protein L3476_28160 [Paenibacillus thiaminolyticus]